MTKGKSYKPRKSFKEKFWNRVDKTKDCWIYTGYRNYHGYGHINYKKYIFAHVYSWEEINGEVPKGSYVCHKCDNPPCCNPDHLFLGDAEVNAKDRESKGRGNQPVGFKNGKCKYNSDIKQIIVFKRYLGYTLKSLSHEFNMPIGTVSVIYLRSKENRATKMKAMGREHRIW